MIWITLRQLILYNVGKMTRLLTVILILSLLMFCSQSFTGRKRPQSNNLESPTNSGLTISNDHGDKQAGASQRVRSQQDVFPYDLQNPEKKYKLPDYLTEISGMAFYKKDDITCVQDEKANIYVFDLGKEEVEAKYDFGKDADFEDIAIDNKIVYVLRNDGQIFRVEDFRKKDRKVTKLDTPLSEKNDTEGLAFDQLSNSLLIACKGSPTIEKENSYAGYRAIYRYDIKEKKLDKEPAFLIDLESLDSYKDYDLFTKFSLKVAKKLRMVESETSFKPSGIAIHPVYGEIYLISNIGKLLIVLNRHGKIMDVQDLDIKIFRQPEGICFSPGGDMYISNEGQGGKGYILKFKFNPNE